MPLGSLSASQFAIPHLPACIVAVVPDPSCYRAAIGSAAVLQTDHLSPLLARLLSTMGKFTLSSRPSPVAHVAATLPSFLQLISECLCSSVLRQICAGGVRWLLQNSPVFSYTFPELDPGLRVCA